jgi:hypothetical protein
MRGFPRIWLNLAGIIGVAASRSRIVARCDVTHRLNMKTKSLPQLEPSAAATVAGEDIACGEYVSVLNERVDLPSYLWDCCGASLSPHELVSLRFIPENAGQPLKVIAICLPFVYAQAPTGQVATIDTRRMPLVRLNRNCAKVVVKPLPSSAKQLSGSAAL